MQNMTLSKLILSNLVRNEPFARKVLPYLKKSYLEASHERRLLAELKNYLIEYRKHPSKDALLIQIGNSTGINETEFKEVVSLIDDIYSGDVEDNLDWLVDTTEKYCQEKAVQNAIMESISIIDGKDEKKSKGVIPQLLQDALAVSFDPSVGHDYLEDIKDRYKFIHASEQRIAFDLSYLNRVTRGGLPRKSLSIILAGTGVGKSMFMCHHAAACLAQNYNVLYVTLEMAEERIAERIDANMLDVPLDQLYSMSEETYVSKMERIKNKYTGRLIIKEYPTTSASVVHFRSLLNELNIKKKFKPDIIFIDYLNICASSRTKMGGSVNSYTYIKAIAEEMRGLAVEFNVPIVSATQTTRTGYQSSDLELTDTSESFGLPATCDFMIGLISTDELEGMGQIMVKQLKNRWGDLNKNRKFLIGVQKSHMRFYDLEEAAQNNIIQKSFLPSKPPAPVKSSFDLNHHSILE